MDAGLVWGAGVGAFASMPVVFEARQIPKAIPSATRVGTATKVIFARSSFARDEGGVQTATGGTEAGSPTTASQTTQTA